MRTANRQMTVLRPNKDWRDGLACGINHCRWRANACFHRRISCCNAVNVCYFLQLTQQSIHFPVADYQFSSAHQIAPRSEEHTSELQSLMRISYAVFCLKNKTQKSNKQTLDIYSLC